MASTGTNLVTVATNILHGTGVICGAVSGLVTGVAADGDLFALRKVSAKPFAVTQVRIRWVTTTAFGSAQGLAFRVNKVYGFTAVHDTNATAIQAHYKYQEDVTGTSTGDRIALTDISAVVATTAAMTGSTYTAEDADEPDFFAVGAGSTLPGVYDDWTPSDKFPLVLTQNTGLVVNNHIAMGASGVGNLFVAVEGFYL